MNSLQPNPKGTSRSIGLDWVFLALAASPAALLAWLIVNYGVDVPLMDQWMPDIAGIFIKAHAGTLRFADLWAPHNEHRIFVPRLIFLVLGSLTHWNTITEMIAQWVAACMTSIGILWLCRRDQEQGTRGISLPTIFMWFICNLLIFAPVQWENWLCGIGLANILPSTFFIATVVIVSSKVLTRTKLGLAMLLASAATFSAGNGMLVWPLAGVLIWSQTGGEAKTRKSALIAWMVGFAINAALYATGFQMPQRSAEQAASASLMRIIRYNIVFLGNPFDFATTLSTAATTQFMGTMLLVMFLLSAAYLAYLCRKGSERELCGRARVWLVVGAYAIGSSVLASLFRAQLGLQQAASLRYISFSIYLPIALVNLVPMICADLARRAAEPAAQRIWQQVPALLASALILLTLMSVPHDLTTVEEIRRGRRQAKAELLLLSVFSDRGRITEDLCFEPDRVITDAPKLNQMGYIRPPLVSSIAELLHPGVTTAPAATGMLERMWLSGPTEVTMTGWAMLPDGSEPAHAVLLTCEDERGQPMILAVTRCGQERPDIVQQEHNGACRLSGWTTVINAQRLPSSLKLVKISAWGMDIRTGRVFGMAGVMNLTR